MGNQAAYDRTLKALRRELDQVEGRAARIRAAISSITELLDAPATNGTTHHQRRPRRSVQLDTVEEVLRETGRPMHVEDIILQMQRRGVGSPDRRKLKLSLVRSLDRKHDQGDRFIKVQPATYFIRRNGHSGTVAESEADDDS